MVEATENTITTTGGTQQFKNESVGEPQGGHLGPSLFQMNMLSLPFTGYSRLSGV